MKAFYMKHKGDIVPTCDVGIKIKNRLKEGELCEVEHVKGRDYENHKRLFAFFKLTMDMQDVFDNIDIWRSQLLLLAGHVNTLIDFNGMPCYEVKSISYAALKDEDKFKELFNNVINGFIKRYGNGITYDEFMTANEF